ncbi:hypothetical protein ES702_00383 [subsurface metagenome]
MAETLGMYDAGKSIKNSPYVKWGRETLEAERWWYDCQKVKPEDRERCIQARQKRVIELYHSLKKYGHLSYTKVRKKVRHPSGRSKYHSPITVYFNRDGEIQTYDGFHRLCIMKYLKIKTKVEVVISKHDPNPKRKGDFPLVRTLMKLNSGKYLYQPCNDPRLKDFKVWRKDSPQRANYVLRRLKGKTALDIGCCEGYFCRKLAANGYKVTALDNNRKRLAVTRYLSTIKNWKMKYYLGSWSKYLKGDVYFDNILFLSTFHHNILSVGVEEAFKLLRRFRGKAGRVFFEMPLSAKHVKWLKKEKQRKSFHFTEAQFKARIEKEMNMKVKHIWRRPSVHRTLFLLVKK